MSSSYTIGRSQSLINTHRSNCEQPQLSASNQRLTVLRSPLRIQPSFELSSGIQDRHIRPRTSTCPTPRGTAPPARFRTTGLIVTRLTQQPRPPRRVNERVQLFEKQTAQQWGRSKDLEKCRNTNPFLMFRLLSELK